MSLWIKTDNSHKRHISEERLHHLFPSFFSPLVSHLFPITCKLLNPCLLCDNVILMYFTSCDLNTDQCSHFTLDLRKAEIKEEGRKSELSIFLNHSTSFFKSTGSSFSCSVSVFKVCQLRLLLQQHIRGLLLFGILLGTAWNLGPRHLRNLKLPLSQAHVKAVQVSNRRLG